MSALTSAGTTLRIDSPISTIALKKTVNVKVHLALIACTSLLGSCWADPVVQPGKLGSECAIVPLRTTPPLMGSISCICVSPDGKLVAACAQDPRIGIFRLDGTAQPTFLDGQGDQVRVLTFRNDNKALVASLWDRTARIWDLQRGIEEARFSMERSISLLVTRDNKTLIAGDDRYLHFIAIDNNFKNRYVSVKISAYRLKCSISGDTIAAVDYSGRIWFLSLRGDVLRTIDTDHKRAVTDAKFIRGGASFATSSSDHHVKVWNTATGHLEHDLHEDNPRGCFDRVYAFGYSDKYDAIITYSLDNKIRVWNLSLERVERTTLVDMKNHIRSSHSAESFSPNNDFLIVGTESGSLLIFGTAELWVSKPVAEK